MTVSFGKYRGQPVERLLGDRNYCNYLLEQKWFWDDVRYRELHEQVANAWLKQSLTYDWGYGAGERDVYRRLDRVLSTQEFELVRARINGCTCSEPPRDDDAHSRECPYLALLRKWEAERERRAEEQRRRDEQRCEATRTNGERCRGTRWRGTPYCHYHQRQTGVVVDAAERFQARAV